MSEYVIQIPDRYGPREMLHNTHACIEDGQKFKWQMLQKNVPRQFVRIRCSSRSRRLPLHAFFARIFF